MTTRIWLLSDLHVDADPWRPDEVPCHDVCIVAGDVRDGLVRSIAWLAEHVVPRSPRVLYTPGNHDYYRHRWQSELARGRDAAAEAGITLLAVGEATTVGPVRFLGGTLWTDYALHGAALRSSTMAHCGDRIGGMRDHRQIRLRLADGATNAFRPPAVMAEHVLQRSRIEALLAEPHEGQTVVITHHAPHPRSLLGGAVRETIDAAYASDLTPILGGTGAPALWVHGHVHVSRDYRLGRTRVVSNPRGRPGENPSFNPSLTVTL